MATSDRSQGLDPGWYPVIGAIVVVVALALVFVTTSLWLVTSFDDRPLIVVLGVATLYVAIVAFLFARVLVVFRRRSARLDAVIAPLGLAGEVYQTLYRRYRGVFRGRSVVITFSRGPNLEIAVATPLQTRLSVSSYAHVGASRLADLAHHEPLVLQDPAMAELTVVAEDAAWARRLLAQPGIPRRLARVTEATGSTFTYCQVAFLPGVVQLVLSGVRTPFSLAFASGPLSSASGMVRAWLDDLLALTAAAEALSPPRSAGSLNVTVRPADQPSPSSRYLLVWAAVIGALFLTLAAVIVVVIIFALA